MTGHIDDILSAADRMAQCAIAITGRTTMIRNEPPAKITLAKDALRQAVADYRALRAGSAMPPVPEAP